jgi:hypothetical protein
VIGAYRVKATRWEATGIGAMWELSLGLWLVVKGFKPSPITADMADPMGPHVT